MFLIKRTLSFLLVTVLTFSVRAQKFSVSYQTSSFAGPFTGRVILFLSKDTKSPKDGNAGLPETACFAMDVKNIKPGTSVLFDDRSVSYPVKLSDMERGNYYVQAIWDRNLGGRSMAGSPGNIFSNSKVVSLSRNYQQTFSIGCTEVNTGSQFPASKFANELSVPSAALTSFYGRPTSVNGAVVLPAEYYSHPEKKYPVLFEISGYGGDYVRDFLSFANADSSSVLIDSIPFIYVLLDGNCPLGHSEYANSDNNGPWATALIKEFIPQLDKLYRTEQQRYLWGHSSGGWSVLWLQMNYPETFAACWSSSPDPVDFRSFCGIDLYTSPNIFYRKDSSLTSVATVAGYFPWIYMRDYYGFERVVNRGEQLRSFDAVFSKPGKDGASQALCNYSTGEIDPAVVEQWKRYDISLLIRNSPEKYLPALNGRVRVSVGNNDNFMLDRAVRKLESELKKLNAYVQFNYYPGDHFTVGHKEYMLDGLKFIADRYRMKSGNQEKKGY